MDARSTILAAMSGGGDDNEMMPASMPEVPSMVGQDGGDPMAVLMQFVPPEAIPQVVEAAIALLLSAAQDGGGMGGMGGMLMEDAA